MDKNDAHNLALQLKTITEKYEQIESELQIPNLHDDVLLELHKCWDKLKDLINLDAQISSDNMLYFQMALFLLREKMGLQIELLKKHIYLKNTFFVSSPNISLTTIGLNANYESVKTPSKQDNERKKKLQGIIDNLKVVPKISGLKDVAGLCKVKKELQTVVVLPIFQPQLYSSFNISNCVLLFGPPGTGKTLLAHALAAEAKTTLYSVSISDIVSSYVGESEKMLKSIFQHVCKEKLPSILFIDEIDGLCRQRNESENEHSRRLKTEFLCQMANFETCPHAFLICATNCPWDLDTAFMRRFNKRIYIPLPSRSDRFEFLKLYTINTPLEQTSQYWGGILSRTDCYSGSDIANLIRHALNIPISELVDVKFWKLVDSKFYEPSDSTNQLGLEIISCSLHELPKNSVRARQAQFSDLLAATNQVRRTVSVAEVNRYETYISKF